MIGARAIVVWIDLSKRSGGAERDQRDIDDVVAEAPAVRPAAWNESAIFERILNRALQHVAPEDAEAMETLGARQPRRRGGEVDLDQVGDEYGVEQPWNDRRRSQRMCQFGFIGIFCVERRVHCWRGLGVAIFIHLRDQSLAEQRIALPSDLYQMIILKAAYRRVDSGNLRSPELRQWNVEDDGVNIEFRPGCQMASLACFDPARR